MFRWRTKRPAAPMKTISIEEEPRLAQLKYAAPYTDAERLRDFILAFETLGVSVVGACVKGFYVSRKRWKKGVLAPSFMYLPVFEEIVRVDAELERAAFGKGPRFYLEVFALSEQWTCPGWDVTEKESRQVNGLPLLQAHEKGDVDLEALHDAARLRLENYELNKQREAVHSLLDAESLEQSMQQAFKEHNNRHALTARDKLMLRAVGTGVSKYLRQLLQD